MEKPVEEFLVGKIYGSRVVIMNSGITEVNVDVISEIPAGSIPMGSLNQLSMSTKNIQSFQTVMIQSLFYFPAEGDFGIYPATIVQSDKIIAMAEEARFAVVHQKKKKKLQTMLDILEMGNTDDIISFLETHNIHNQNIFNFNDIYWLLKNEQFYSKLKATLTRKGVYQRDVWKFSIYHNDLQGFRELMGECAKDKLHFIKYLDSKYVQIDSNQLKEYHPLINPRAHSFSHERQNIIN